MHVFPDCACDLAAIDVEADEEPEILDSRLVHELAAVSDGQDVLIMVDAFGASPANAAMRIADGLHVRVVSGLNVPMLWRVLCYRRDGLDALVTRAVAGGVQGVMQVSVPPRQHQAVSLGSSTHDQVQHPDSQ